MTAPRPWSTESTPLFGPAAPAVPPIVTAATIAQANRLSFRIAPGEVSAFGVRPR